MMQTAIKTRVVGIDIEQYFTKYAIVDVRGQIIAQGQFATTDYPQVNGFVSHLCDVLIELIEANGGYETIRSVGVSVTSGNSLTGCIENSPNLAWKGQIPLAALMRDRLGLAVILANNAHVRALGEQAFGSAHGMRDFLVVTLGYGIGSCLVSGGRAYRGNEGFAGELGHVCVVPGGRECGCGRRGCLEAYCAERGIRQTAIELLAESDAPSLMRGKETLSPHVITELCEQGDDLAREVYRRTGHLLGTALANYATLTNPDAIIFTGGLVRAGHWLLDPMSETFKEHVFRNVQGKIRLLVSSLDDSERDVLGASALAWNVKEYSLFK